MTGLIVGLSVFAYVAVWLVGAAPIAARATAIGEVEGVDVLMGMLIGMLWPVAAVLAGMYLVSEYVTFRPVRKAGAQKEAEIAQARKIRDLEVELGLPQSWPLDRRLP
jgi:hypothetical protein